MVVFFDFDGTLTATPGDRAARGSKLSDLCKRAPMLAPRLRALRGSGVSIGIISKSTEATIRSALEAAGLNELFDAPLVGKAVGFEGKAGFIEELAQKGSLPRLGHSRGHCASARRVLLVDDDMSELERARSRGIQTYAAPEEGGLREEDFDAIMKALTLPRRQSVPLSLVNHNSDVIPTAWAEGDSAVLRDKSVTVWDGSQGRRFRSLIMFSGCPIEG